MTTMKYKMQGSWTVYDIRKMCIQNEFYTCGTNKQYEKLMNFVSDHEPTMEAIEWVAKDIIDHSSFEYDYPITSMMFHVVNDCVKFFFTEDET